MRANSIAACAALLLLASNALASSIPANASKVCLYDNLEVVASAQRSALIFETLRWLIPSKPVYVPSLPAAAELATCQALVVPGNKGSFWAQEGLAASASARAALGDYVKSGRVLVLADGYTSGGGNQFFPLLDYLLGEPSRCVAYPVTADFLVYSRTSEAAGLPSPLKIKPDTGVSTLLCPSSASIALKAVYTGTEPSAKKAVSVANLWGVGNGAVLWIGSGYTLPNLKGFSDLVANVVKAKLGPVT
ncbi:hypothetical protein GPECTOR_16g558 [Gonium pectorale]|uniref:Uncharacterized protein n=1 Tax=Gonium pectorale TaxID=33097 RepID=A0A150GKX4_GONPE|nr:hypothetical protein GPECTOR_16g558 [Gonium pectorale]|eukprot:KXZ50385.1 hypothetical protein GPECTOR_16g558 [Gonium pectorale]